MEALVEAVYRSEPLQGGGASAREQFITVSSTMQFRAVLVLFEELVLSS